MNVRVYLDRHDAWIGCYWKVVVVGDWNQLALYICPLPFVVVRVLLTHRMGKYRYPWETYSK